MTNNQYQNDELPKQMIKAIQNRQTAKTMPPKMNKQTKKPNKKQDKNTKHQVKTPKTLTPKFHVLNDQYPIQN